MARVIQRGRYAGADLSVAHDGVIRSPLWEFAPADRPAVIHERRRRFGVPSADDFDPEYH